MKNFAVIFDMDGVLIDSLKYIEAAFTHALEPHGITMAQIREKHGRFYHGGSLKDFLKVLNEHHGLMIDEQDFSAQAREVFFKLIKEDNVKAEPALIQLLTDLKMLRIPCGVGSSSKKIRVTRILEELSIAQYFTVVHGAEAVERHKPHPDIFLSVAKELGYEPNTCVVIEDAPKGIDAARRAKMKVIAYDAFSDDDVKPTGADLLIHNFSELTPEKIASLLD